jgi:hypothetical protein
MPVLKALNLLVRFLLELCMLGAVGYWGLRTGSASAMKIILGIGLPILIAVAWWFAWKLSGIPRLALELTCWDQAQLPCLPVTNRTWAGSIQPFW